MASAAQGVHSRRDCGKIAFEIPILACSNGTLLRGLTCVEVRSCDSASRSHRHTEGL
jgi:hypothetical protein